MLSDQGNFTFAGVLGGDKIAVEDKTGKGGQNQILVSLEYVHVESGLCVEQRTEI